ncbi:MAG: COX15/CtaA family protein [Burkholderiales bacterium]
MQENAIWQFSLDALHLAGWLIPLLLVLYGGVRWLGLRALVVVTTLATLLLVSLGAYVRLTDAGLGCPDWPGCYGKLSPIHAAEEIRNAEQAAPLGPVSAPKAWNEMLHRYLATLVGALILAIAIRALLRRRALGADSGRPETAIGLPLALVFAVILQGLFGKWTVTLLLKPAIVTLHLLGGMLILVLLAWLSARQCEISGPRDAARARRVRPWALAALAVAWIQVALGGWVSTNYAGLACVDFPTCHGRWLPEMDFAHGFHFIRELGMTATGEPLSNQALNAIHWTHRVGALITVGFVSIVAILAWPAAELRRFAASLIVVLAVQVAIGIGNVVAMLPLWLAVAHNTGAALLLVALVMLNFALYSRPAR